MSACGRVGCPTKRSMAWPPATHQGKPDPGEERPDARRRQWGPPAVGVGRGRQDRSSFSLVGVGTTGEFSQMINFCICQRSAVPERRAHNEESYVRRSLARCGRPVDRTGRACTAPHGRHRRRPDRHRAGLGHRHRGGRGHRPPAPGHRPPHPDRAARPARRSGGQGGRHVLGPGRLLRLGDRPRGRRPPDGWRGLVPGLGRTRAIWSLLPLAVLGRRPRWSPTSGPRPSRSASRPRAA